MKNSDKDSNQEPSLDEFLSLCGHDPDSYQLGLLHLVQQRMCCTGDIDELTLPLFVCLMQASEALMASPFGATSRDRIYLSLLEGELAMTRERLDASASPATTTGGAN
jgi:hypothetical protein